ncbi:MAG: hypothetical protein DMD52_11365 [Gemmatimonadetes bacterium]|nr:MAG: hypothetical protein DMD52_11365 [Gemmatimonadota bacterium]
MGPRAPPSTSSTEGRRRPGSARCPCWTAWNESRPHRLHQLLPGVRRHRPGRRPAPGRSRDRHALRAQRPAGRRRAGRERGERGGIRPQCPRLRRATVLLTASSRTSVHLLELLCKDVWHVQPRFAQARAEAADLDGLAGLPHDAVLVIGDPALLLAARHAYAHRYDLGEEWKRWTGLPFVFAVWAARRAAARHAVHEVHQALLESRAWGLEHLDLLAEAAARACNVPRETCLEYFAGLDYALSYKHLAGLTDFFRRLAARGIVPDGSLRFLQVA